MEGEKSPIIAVTMGDPAGIGPEICIKALLKPKIYDTCCPIIIGDERVLKSVAERIEVKVNFHVIESPIKASYKPGSINLIDLENVDVRILEVGKPTIIGGRASIQYIERAVEYALRGEVAAVTTGPINKKAIQMAGCPYIGHTEMLAGLCGVKDPLLMFWVKGVKIFFLTRHMPLIKAVQSVKRERIVETVRRIVREMRKIGIENPTIAVAALNPHASDDGLMGWEETQEIAPAVEDLRREGFSVIGPVPADSVFFKAFSGDYDVVLSLYHDQGHIAAKTVDFFGTVSVTLGLPFIRTSVDHGTAYDIAWKGIADSRSLEEAVRLAASLVIGAPHK
ncbi:MAG: 4-hydroxythreonine-4-phosphate dehydrogenase PdxA [Nitrososphaerota archaeon]|nr:4-hydroxythreonine-4-phosphate dehydrogenase PdxA [Candidatus Bathyarchaeota archaeon]MDW8048146.1 4-hydroxythreonine-4-phosphate dehydrogenase PdxA [Nitrososphaerota archaeon]